MSIKEQQDSFHRLVLPQIDSLGNKKPVHVVLYKYRLKNKIMFLAVAQDTVRPEFITLMLASKGSAAINEPAIYDSTGKAIRFDNITHTVYEYSVKDYPIKSTVEITWDTFDNICRLDSIRLTVTEDTIYLDENIVFDLKILQRYFIERDPTEPPIDNPTDDYVLPAVLKKIDPVYPQVALDLKLPGGVIVNAWLDREGRVRHVAILKSTNEIFNSLALEAVRQWTFAPAKILGRPAAVWVTLPFHYELKR